MTFKRKVAPVVALTTVALALTACASSSRDTGSTDSSSGASSEGAGTFTFGAAGAPKLFDPFYATDGETFRVSRQIFDTLVDIKAGAATLEPSTRQDAASAARARATAAGRSAQGGWSGAKRWRR